MITDARLGRISRHVVGSAHSSGLPTAHAVVPTNDRELVAAGEAQALKLPNRGPLWVNGWINPSIAPLFEEYGFFVIEGAIAEAELADLRRDIGGFGDLHGDGLIDRAPAERGAALDKAGRPAEVGRGKAKWNFQPPLSAIRTFSLH